jgi:ribokinase
LFDIISIGSATRDVFFSADELKKFKMDEFPTGEAICLGYGSKIEMKKIVLTSGGGGTNAAVTYARQGLKTAYIGVVGQDFNGTEIINELNREGINTDYIQKHNDTV